MKDGVSLAYRACDFLKFVSEYSWSVNWNVMSALFLASCELSMKWLPSVVCRVVQKPKKEYKLFIQQAKLTKCSKNKRNQCKYLHVLQSNCKEDFRHHIQNRRVNTVSGNYTKLIVPSNSVL
jgi:hypothetical protein